MFKCLIVLCVGTLLVVDAAPAPQSQKNPIDFLLDLNQDVLDKEVPASVKPISQAQVRTTTETNSQEPAPVFEAQADVKEIPREPIPTASQLNTNRDETEDQDQKDNDDRSDSEDESEQQDQQSSSKDNEGDNKEDTTIRVYGDEDENDENNETDESVQPNEREDENQGSERKAEPEVYFQPQINSPEPKEEISQHADTEKQFDVAVEQSGADLLQEQGQVTIPEQSDSLDEQQQQQIDVKPDQLFNHGSIVFDKSTFADEDLSSTTPFSNKKWNDDHGPPGFGPWHTFPGFPEHKHEDGRPPFFGMPPFDGPPPRFDGPPHWHFHNHSHDHGDWHHHGDDVPPFHGGGGHGFHRRGPWNWNRS